MNSTSPMPTDVATFSQKLARYASWLRIREPMTVRYASMADRSATLHHQATSGSPLHHSREAEEAEQPGELAGDERRGGQAENPAGEHVDRRLQHGRERRGVGH